MTDQRVYFKRGDREVETPYNGYRLVGFEGYTGHVGGTPCFRIVRVANDVGRETVVTESAISGAAAVKVWSPGKPAAYFGVAEESTVARRNSNH